jgi:hypothetical protein
MQALAVLGACGATGQAHHFCHRVPKGMKGGVGQFPHVGNLNVMRTERALAAAGDEGA